MNLCSTWPATAWLHCPARASRPDIDPRTESHYGHRQQTFDRGQCRCSRAIIGESTGSVQITPLNRAPKDFSNKEIVREIERGEQIQALFVLAIRLLPRLGISNERIRCYTTLVSYYSVFSLSQLNERLVYTYLLCFVFHRYQKIRDNLIQRFVYQVRRYLDGVKQLAKERVYTHRIEHHRNLQKAGQILRLFTDGEIAPYTPFSEVRQRAFGILDLPELERVAARIPPQRSTG